MNKLSYDEFILIILKLKTDYNKKILDYKIKINELTEQRDIYKKICWTESHFNLTGKYRCEGCNEVIYDGTFGYYNFDNNISDDDFDCNNILSNNYIKCNLCKKKYCLNCQKINAYISVNPNLFYCIECYNKKDD
tara:strand:- start:669 stop:1073 length:405 start_codon:yes stop_codon:yes gene_type:complete